MRRRTRGALALGLALALPVVGLAFDAEYTASQTVTISQAGSYLVTGTGSGSVTVSANVTGAELTISNVTWTGDATKINIGNGASLLLVLEGSSSIIHTGKSSGPGIKLPQTSSLTVFGTGELDMNVRNFWPCIGVGNTETMGSLTINGGTIIAYAEQGLSAAIGGGYGNPQRGGNGGTVIVNGGKLVAVGYSDAPGIGGGNGYSTGGGGDAGTLTVNGGHVIAMTRHTGTWYGTYAAPAVGPGATARMSRNTAPPGASQ